MANILTKKQSSAQPDRDVIKAVVNLETGSIHQWTHRLAARPHMQAVWYNIKERKVVDRASASFDEIKSLSSTPVMVRPIYRATNNVGDVPDDGMSALDKALKLRTDNEKEIETYITGAETDYASGAQEAQDYETQGEEVQDDGDPIANLPAFNMPVPGSVRPIQTFSLE